MRVIPTYNRYNIARSVSVTKPIVFSGSDNSASSGANTDNEGGQDAGFGPHEALVQFHRAVRALPGSDTSVGYRTNIEKQTRAGNPPGIAQVYREEYELAMQNHGRPPTEEELREVQFRED